MKVKIGKYLNYWGPYQIAELVCFWVPKKEDEYGFKEFPDWVERFGEILATGSFKKDSDKESLLNKFCQWIYDKRKRTVKVKIHDYDTWCLDTTLALVIVPTLEKFRNSERNGVPNFILKELGFKERTLEGGFVGHTEEELQKADAEFNKILDKMIWSFKQVINSDESPDVPVDFSTDEFFNTGYSRITPEQREQWQKEYEKYNKRVQEGLDLFAKYYTCLWD